jgi:predicted aspartyl protease
MEDMRIEALWGRDSDDLRETTFVLDARSFYTIVPPSVANELKLPATLRASIVFDGRTIPSVRIGMAYLRLMEREGGVPFGVLDVPEPLLGVTALEALGLKLDETGETLEYAAAYGSGALLLDEEDF